MKLYKHQVGKVLHIEGPVDLTFLPGGRIGFSQGARVRVVAKKDIKKVKSRRKVR